MQLVQDNFLNETLTLLLIEKESYSLTPDETATMLSRWIVAIKSQLWSTCAQTTHSNRNWLKHACSHITDTEGQRNRLQCCQIWGNLSCAYNAYASIWRGRTQAKSKHTCLLVYAYVNINMWRGQLRKLMGKIGGDHEEEKWSPPVRDQAAFSSLYSSGSQSTKSRSISATPGPSSAAFSAPCNARDKQQLICKWVHYTEVPLELDFI